MRVLQVIFLLAGVGAFLAALFTAGSVLGDILWRAGVAVLLADVVLIMLWPTPTARDG